MSVDDGIDVIKQDLAIGAYLVKTLLKQWVGFVILLCVPFTWFFVEYIQVLEKNQPMVVVVKKSFFQSVKVGDSIFAQKRFLTDTTKQLQIFELYRPEQAADIRKMKLSVKKQKQLISKLDTVQSNAGYPVYKFSAHQMYTTKRMFIGTVIGKDTTIVFENDLNTTPYHFEIKPVLPLHNKNIRTSAYGNFYPMNRFYVKANEVDTVDLFRKKK